MENPGGNDPSLPNGHQSGANHVPYRETRESPLQARQRFQTTQDNQHLSNSPSTNLTESRHVVDDDERPNGTALPAGRNDVRVNVTVTTDEVNEATPVVFTTFLVNQMKHDGYDLPRELERNRVESATANELLILGDRLYNQYSNTIDNFVSQIEVTPDTVYERFYNIASKLFKDQVNWARIVALFIFGYKLTLKVMNNESPLVFVIVEWITKFVADRLSLWIASQGGWGAICAHYSTTRQTVAVLLAGVALIAFVWYWRKS